MTTKSWKAWKHTATAILQTLTYVAINNTSSRRQESYGTDIQLTFLNDLMGMENQLIMGFTYYKGESRFRFRN